jgi:Domain of unknown function (DUF4185)
MTLFLAPGSLIQGPFLNNGVPNFEAVLYVPETSELQHYFRENHRPEIVWWNKAEVINARAFPVMGAGAICQSSFGSRGNFEVVVPEPGGLAHYWRDNDHMETPWQRAGIIAPNSVGSGAIIQNRRNGDLEVVVRHGRELVHYWRSGGIWRSTAQPISRDASGAAAIIQSSYSDNLELVVREGMRIVLYWREWNAAGQPWKPGGVVVARATGDPAFIQGKFGSVPHTNFEVVFPVDDRLELYWRDNTPTGNQMWKPGGVVTRGAGPVNAVAMTRGSREDQLDMLTQECWESVFQYYRYQDNGKSVYLRNGCLRVHEGRLGESYPDPRSVPPQSFKINQMTGTYDAQLRENTLSAGGRVTKEFIRTSGDPNIRGTDLGASFQHNGNLYFLFGDTHWKGGVPPADADVMAYTPDTNPWNGASLYFHKSYLEVRFPGLPRGFCPKVHGVVNVPQDGFSFREHIFAFFTTDSFQKGKVMGRSVLVRCDEAVPEIERSNKFQPLTFHYLTEFSRYRFINVSVQYASAAASRQWRLPDGREGLLIWGTGSYRTDHIYLAFLPLHDENLIHEMLFSQHEIPREHLPVLYYRGTERGQSPWSTDERDAVPMFYPAAIGELSVRWDPTMRAFVMMYMSGRNDPINPSVLLRLSRTPWGPWSRRRMAFNWILDGLGFRYHSNAALGSDFKGKRRWFIHVSTKQIPEDDGLGDDIIGGRGPEEGGEAYAPYHIPRFTRRDGGAIHLFYALSTWNPYQVVLMRHAITEWERFRLLDGFRFADFIRAIRSGLTALLSRSG